MDDAKQLGSKIDSFRTLGLVAGLTVCVMAILLLVASAVIAQDATGSATSDDQLGMLQFIGSGKIRLELHDPAGQVVSRETNEIDGATYTDEDNQVVIEIPHRIIGDYKLYVYADGSANRIHLFDVSVTDGAQTIPLAERVMIVNVPSEPFIIRSTQEGFENATATTTDQLPSSTADTGSAGDTGGSSSFLWIVLGAALVVAALIAGFFLMRARKHRT